MAAQQQLLGYGLTILGAALFSTKAIFIKLAFQEEVNASLMLAWRMIFSMPVFLTIGVLALWRMRRQQQALPTRRIMFMSALTGFLGYGISAYLDFKGLEFISAQLERLVLFTYPLFIMFIGALWFRQPLTRDGIFSCIITYLGLAIVFGVDVPAGGLATVVGTGLVLGCALTFALQQLLAKSLIASTGAVIYTSLSMFAGGAFCLALHGLVDGDFSATPGFLYQALGCAVFATILPIFCINGGLARISAQAVAMISTLSPIATIALSVYVLGEAFTWADAMGSSLVLAGVGYYTWAEAKRRRPEPIEDV